jgi:AraC-like DNA-binding protein
MGREVRCDPGALLLERGDEPYRFSYADRNDLLVLKVSKPVLAERLRDPDRFCARPLDARGGVGHLFARMAATAMEAQGLDGRASGLVSRQLVELLALALDGAPDVAGGAGSAVRAAHLARAKAHICRHLPNPDLSPASVAEACGVSKRYLHELFTDENATVSQFIREERLLACRDLLEAPAAASIAEVAYRFGFSDQAQFSRLFKAAFGETPSGFRARAGRPGASESQDSE